MGFSSVPLASMLIICLVMSTALISIAVNPLKRISACKKKCNEAFLLCRNKVAASPKERLQCAKLYVITFPSCFFGDVTAGKNCERVILKDFSTCVLQSLSYGETFACAAKKQNELKKCQSSSKREATDGSSSLQTCNECFGSYDVCIGIAKSEKAHDICVAAKDYCAKSC